MVEIEIKEGSQPSAEKKIVGTQIPMEFYEKLKEEADREFMSISDLLRKLIVIHYREGK